MKKSEDINELAAALAVAQSSITGARKSSANPFFKSNYADLAEVWEACREPLSSQGLALVQFPYTTEDGKVALESTLMHKSGQWITCDPLAWKPAKPDIQSVGGLITYMRRYAAAAIVGVAQVDDDGNEASGKAPGGGSQGRPHSTESPTPKKQAYTIDQVSSNADAWVDALQDGKTTVENIIKMIKSTYLLPPNVEALIRQELR